MERFTVKPGDTLTLNEGLTGTGIHLDTGEYLIFADVPALYCYTSPKRDLIPRFIKQWYYGLRYKITGKLKVKIWVDLSQTPCYTNLR